MRVTSSKLLALGSKHRQATFAVCVSEAGNAWTFGSHGINTKVGFWRGMAPDLAQRDSTSIRAAVVRCMADGIAAKLDA